MSAQVDANSHTQGHGMPGEATRPRIHIVYFALALFDLLAITLSLVLIDRISALHVESIQVTQVWGRRLDDYVDLMRMAAAVNAPGNDVFNTRDAEGESNRLDIAHAAFLARASELRREVSRAPDQGLVDELLGRFDAI